MSFVLPSGLLKDEPATWYGGAHIDVKQVAAMERALFAAYPTVTVINLADVLDRIESVVDQITFVVRLLAGFSILAGLMILASSIASARFRRMREAVVLKTLGATRMRIVRTFSVEFSVLGLLAGSVGVVFANMLTRVLLHRFDVTFTSTGMPRWSRSSVQQFWPRPQDGLRVIAFWGCGRWKCCAKSRRQAGHDLPRKTPR